MNSAKRKAWSSPVKILVLDLYIFLLYFLRTCFKSILKKIDVDKVIHASKVLSVSKALQNEHIFN